MDTIQIIFNGVTYNARYGTNGAIEIDAPLSLSQRHSIQTGLNMLRGGLKSLQAYAATR